MWKITILSFQISLPNTNGILHLHHLYVKDYHSFTLNFTPQYKCNSSSTNTCMWKITILSFLILLPNTNGTLHTHPTVCERLPFSHFKFHSPIQMEFFIYNHLYVKDYHSFILNFTPQYKWSSSSTTTCMWKITILSFFILLPYKNGIHQLQPHVWERLPFFHFKFHSPIQMEFFINHLYVKD